MIFIIFKDSYCYKLCVTNYQFFMKRITRHFSIATLGLLFMVSCGQEEKKKESLYPDSALEKTATEQSKAQTPQKESSPTKVDLSNKGIGPVKSVELTAIDDQLVAQGQEIFKNMCTACHKPTKKFIGPAPQGVLERRSPEWIMNMILNPEEMVQKDPIAQELLKEYNGSPMANQNLNEEEARAVLEYFRSL